MVTIQRVGVGFSVGLGVTVTLITFAVGDGVATTVVGVGAITATGVGVLVGVAPVAVGFNLTAIDWLESIYILAVLPSMLKTGPTHSSTCQPCLGRMSMVTTIPCE